MGQKNKILIKIQRQRQRQRYALVVYRMSKVGWDFRGKSSKKFSEYPQVISSSSAVTADDDAAANAFLYSLPAS